MRALLTAAAVAVAAAATLTYDPAEFRTLGRSDANARLMVTAALPQRNVDVLDGLLMEISDPSNPKYGQWLTQDFVNTLTAPDARVREEVREWMTSTGGRCVDWPSSLRCSLAVSQVESLLSTQLTAFHHLPKDKVIHRIHPNDVYTFPSHLEGKLLFITNLVEFPTVRRKLGRGIEAMRTNGAGTPEATDYMVIVESLNAFYNMAGVTPTYGNNGSSAAPAEFQADTSYSPADLKVFAGLIGQPDWTIPADHRVGPFTPSEPDAEATLDTQYLGAVARGDAIQPWYWTEADWQYEFVQHLAQLPDSGVPKIFSISWGWYEGDQCTVDPTGPCNGKTGKPASYAYVNATNAGFLAATSRGISIMVSSGDSGAHGRTDGGCASKETRPDWPTACPYITAVGATQVEISSGKPIANPVSPYCKAPTQGDCVGSGTEIVCSTATGALIVSGGGFSNVAPQPTWQTKAVATYLASKALLPPTGDFNKTGRGYPDVAILGHNYLIQLGGQLTPVDGTSCSSPVFAGMVALLNSARLNKGKPVLGFLNPFLYQTGATAGVWNDVTIGDNTCTEDGCVTGCTGFGATTGWDATTGWGSPNFQNLLAQVNNLP